RTGLSALLATADDMECIGQAPDGDRALDMIAELEPDVVLLDLSMPGSDGVSVIRELRASDSPARVLVLTSFSDAGLVLDAVHAGADGYLLKQSDGEQILDGVRAVAAGEAPVDPAVARSLLRDVREHRPSALREVRERRPSAPTVPLTDRETQVLEMLRAGYPNKSIARRLAISERTVKVHVSHIFQRIGVNDRTQAALWAERHLPPSEDGEAVP
ncbi:MAG TPA: response regulator transcription factor, partial [Geodermatophilus sp.]|nr:response regulator transcription factor [Geodermatophilus sp.]